MGAAVMSMSHAGLVAFGRNTGRIVVDRIFASAFAGLHAMMAAEQGRPLSAESEANIRGGLDGMMKTVSEELFDQLPKGTDVDKTLFLEAVRSECVECFMERFRAKWASLVTQ